jgi:hypothetical protein
VTGREETQISRHFLVRKHRLRVVEFVVEYFQRVRDAVEGESRRKRNLRQMRPEPGNERNATGRGPAHRPLISNFASLRRNKAGNFGLKSRLALLRSELLYRHTTLPHA